MGTEVFLGVIMRILHGSHCSVRRGSDTVAHQPVPTHFLAQVQVWVGNGR
jgi:hypothetical protein